jgi:hypothetical protein
MDEPLFVVPNTATRWVTAANYDLLIWETRFASVRGLTMKSVIEDDRIERMILGKGRRKTWREATARQQGLAGERAETAVRLSEPELLARAPGNIVLDWSAIAAARLTKRTGLCTMRLTLADGRRLKWQWMNSQMAARYEDVEPVLRRVLGPRLSAS